jgi:DNA-binding response OmpR family regulator
VLFSDHHAGAFSSIQRVASVCVTKPGTWWHLPSAHATRDVILLDRNLPDMSGFDVLRSLRLSKVKTPILILSAIVDTGDKVKALGLWR